MVPKNARILVISVSEGRSCVASKSQKSGRIIGISVSKWVVFGARTVLYFRYFRVVLIASLGALIFGIFDIFDNAHFHRSTLCFSVFSFIIRSDD